MPLEATMICIDNSDFTRNGDYVPTRYAAQTDAVNIVCNVKTQQNIESSVGMLTTAGDRVEVLITPTGDIGKMINELQKVQIKGSADLVRGIQTAQLALKHRQNKNQKQRIVAFVGSPITATDKEMETLGKNLKKNNVSLDLVSFGEVEENTAKLEKLLGAVNSNDSSHILEIPVGPKMLSDVLLSSPVINPDGEAMPGGGDDGFGFGMDPNEDPELALALRISMEEDRQRQEQAAAAEAAARGEAPPPQASGGEAGAVATAAPAAEGGGEALPIAGDAAGLEAMMGMEDMDDELRQALLLSLQESNAAAPAPAPAAAAPAPVAAEQPAPSAADVLPAAGAPKADAAPAPGAGDCAGPAAAPGDSAAAAVAGEDGDELGSTVDAKWFQDPSFVQELLGQLPGVDINDPRIQKALKEVGGDEEAGEKRDGDANGSADNPDLK